MIDWTKMIAHDKCSVVAFATKRISSESFKEDFLGIPHTACYAVKSHGALYARRLARKALRHRGLIA